MKFLTDVTFDADDVTLPMVSQLDTALREYGAFEGSVADHFDDEQTKIVLDYAFECDDLWDARDILHNDVEAAIRDILGDAGRIIITKPRPHPIEEEHGTPVQTS